VGVEAAIARAAEAAIVKSAPRTIGMSRRPECSRGDQDAEKAEREFHRFSFRVTLRRATSDRQLSSRVAACTIFTRQFYLAARSESVGLQRVAIQVTAARLSQRYAARPQSQGAHQQQ